MNRNALRVRDCPVCGLEAKYWRGDRRRDSVFHSDRCKMRAYRFRRRFLAAIAEDLGKGAAPAKLIQVLGWSPRDPRWIPFYWREFGLR